MKHADADNCNEKTADDVTGNGYYVVTVNAVKCFFGGWLCRSDLEVHIRLRGRVAPMTVRALACAIAPADLLRWNAPDVGPAVWIDGQLDEISLTSLFFVGNVSGHRIVFVSGAKVAMKLIDRFNPGNAFERGKSHRLGSFARTAVDKRNARI